LIDIFKRKSIVATGKMSSKLSSLPNPETKIDVASPTNENQPLKIDQAKTKKSI